ncbi:MAG: ATP-binding protein [Opitutaceae bacterium]
MRQRSFRVRLTLLSAAIIGTLLLLFAGQTWLLLRHQFLESIDTRLRLSVERKIGSLNQINRWTQHFTDEGAEWIDAPEDAKFTLLVDSKGEIHFIDGSSDWLLKENYRSLIPKIETDQGPSTNSLSAVAPTRDEPSPSFKSAPRFHTLTDPNGESWRIAVIRNWDRALFMGASIDKLSSELKSARKTLLISVPFAIFLTTFGGWWIAYSALRPLTRVTKTSSQITSLGLSERIPLSGEEYTEFSQLIFIFNNMLDRLERSFNQAQRFTADASHELKTPIALMQAEIHTALKLSNPDTEDHTRLLHLAEEVSRLKQIIHSLLLLSRSDSGQLNLTQEPFNLSILMDELIEDLDLLCEEHNLRFEHKIEPSILFTGDRTMLMQALQNLLDNALKYNKSAGYIRVSVERIFEENIRISVENSGDPIPKNQQKRIFDRFYRCDDARSRTTDGFGLGLNLALEIIHAHKGTLKLHTSNQSYTRFQIDLPAT